MKKVIVLLSLLSITSMAFTQTKFEKVMLTNIDSLYKSFGTPALPGQVNNFERLALMDSTRWEPLYYAAHGCSMMSLNEQDGDKKDALCDRGQAFLDKALAVAPTQSELYVLQGFLYNMRLLVNPTVRAMIYMGKINAAYDTAEKLDSLNPRAYYMRALMVMNMPPFIGGGKDKALPVFAKAKQKFDTFTPANILAPRWGQQDCEKKLGECKTN